MRVETVITCGECRREIATVEATEVRPGFWTNQPTAAIPKQCPICAGPLLRGEQADAYTAQKEHLRIAKERVHITKQPGGVR